MTLAITDYTRTIGTTELDIVTGSAYSSGSLQTTLCSLEIDLDLNALAAGDSFVARLYEKVTAAGTVRSAVLGTYTGVQDDKLVKIPVGIVGHGWAVTLQKIVGTDRSIPCSLRDVS